MAGELIPPFERNDLCWCDSPRKYKACHGRGASSSPGAPVPQDDEDGYWVSPTVRIDRGAMSTSDAFGSAGVPITMQREDRPVAGPLIVPRYAAVLAATPGATDSDFGDSGLRRFDILTEYGLDDESTLARQLDVLSDEALNDVAMALLRNGRLIFDLLAKQALSEARLTAWWRLIPGVNERRA